MAERSDWASLYLTDDIHFNELGHRYLGERVAQAVAAELGRAHPVLERSP